jgi:hypothetical protein
MYRGIGVVFPSGNGCILIAAAIAALFKTSDNQAMRVDRQMPSCPPGRQGFPPPRLAGHR